MGMRCWANRRSLNCVCFLLRRWECLINQLFVCEQAPQAGTKEKTLCCWFCASGPISLSAKIERKGYTPGESRLSAPTLSHRLYFSDSSRFSLSLTDWSRFPSLQGESIQIFAEVENCSSRVVVPKAALYQTQTFFAKGKGKQIQQLVSNLRGDPLLQGKSQSWEGKLLKIPPVSPSILDCPIIKVEYALMVSPAISGRNTERRWSQTGQNAALKLSV